MPFRPSAPREEDLSRTSGVYGCEEGCDIVFLVGRGETEIWRLPAIKQVLHNATPVFQAMFSKHFDPSQQISWSNSTGHLPEIKVTDVDCRAFDNLLRFLYAEEVTFKSVESTLPTLYAAHKYECPGLVQRCTHYLNRNIKETNVLMILNYIPEFCGVIQNLENRNREREMIQNQDLLSSPLGATGRDDLTNVFEPSPLLEQSSPQSQSQAPSPEYDRIETECACFLQNCLQFVDEKAVQVLGLDEMEDLDMEPLRLILSRDTLDIPDENLVFTAILKWADKAVKRQQLPLTPESKREVLGELLFLPRYTTMSLQSFESDVGPAKSGIFTQEEVDCLRKLLRKGVTISDLPSPNSSPVNNPLGIPPSLRPYYRAISRPRHPLRYDLPSPAKKSKRGLALSFVKRWKSRRCCCRRRNEGSQDNSSQLPSPANSNPSSPNHTSTVSRPKKWNVAVERVVVFLACLFE